MRACVFVGPTLRRARICRRTTTSSSCRRSPRATSTASRRRRPQRDRDHRRLLRARALGLAQGDPVGDGRGHPRVRQRQHGRAARRRAACRSACAASAGSSRRIATASSRTTTRSRWSTGRAETGYLALSEAMVNIRARWPRPRAAASSPRRPGMRWSASPRSCSITTAPSSGCSSTPPSESLPAGELDALRAWLPQGRVDQKREDALAMLAAMRALLAERARADAGRLRSGVDRGVGRRDRGCGGEPGRSAPAGPRRGLPTIGCSRSCASRPDTYAAVRDRALLRSPRKTRGRAPPPRGRRRARVESARSPARPPRPVQPRRPRPLARGERHRGRQLERLLEDEAQLEAVQRARRARPARISCSTSCACATISPASPSARAASRNCSRRTAWTIRIRTTRTSRRRPRCGPGISSGGSASRCPTTSTRPRASSASPTGPISIARCAANGYTAHAQGQELDIERGADFVRMCGAMSIDLVRRCRRTRHQVSLVSPTAASSSRSTSLRPSGCSPPAGTIGPGPVGRSHVCDRSDRQAYPYGIARGPYGSPFLYYPPWNGPIRRAAAARRRRPLRPSAESGPGNSRQPTPMAWLGSSWTSGRTISASRSAGISLPTTSDWRSCSCALWTMPPQATASWSLAPTSWTAIVGSSA